jgi:hypothetical protein
LGTSGPTLCKTREENTCFFALITLVFVCSILQHPAKTSRNTFGFLDFAQPHFPDVPDRHALYRGKTPLHAAAWNGQAEVVEKLIAAGAKVDATNDAGHGLRDRGWWLLVSIDCGDPLKTNW